jgi:hypothetical protein
MSIQDLLILNLTLQVFDGLFSYQVFCLGGAGSKSNCFGCDFDLGRDLGPAIQESVGLRSAVFDFRFARTTR